MCSNNVSCNITNSQFPTLLKKLMRPSANSMQLSQSAMIVRFRAIRALIFWVIFFSDCKRITQSSKINWISLGLINQRNNQACLNSSNYNSRKYRTVLKLDMYRIKSIRRLFLIILKLSTSVPMCNLALPFTLDVTNI